MTWLDHYLQRRRMAQMAPFLRPGDRVLDIGSSDGVLFRALDFLGPGGLGIDPALRQPLDAGKFRLMPGMFPQDMPAVEPFDAIALLAVLEHFPSAAYPSLADGCCRFLKPGGKVILTVPSPKVDQILEILQKLRLVHGMALEEHHGFEVRHTREIFAPPRFRLICHRFFQFGLNNLFVFEKSRDLA